MGNPEKLRTVRAMRDRWKADEARLQKLFGDYGEVTGNEYADDAEMQRNLSTAIAYANGFITQFSAKPVASSWYCEPCAVEVYDLRCVHCGKTKRQRR